MITMKLSWIILLALFVAVVYCGNSQSQKGAYQQLTDYTSSDCNAGMDAICKKKRLARFCGLRKECKEFLRKKNLDAYRII